MIKKIIKLFLFFTFLTLFPFPSYAAGSWQKLANGLSYKKILYPQGDTRVEIHAIKINPRFYTIKPMYVSDGATVKKMVQKSNAIAMVNANFFDVQGKPLGLITLDHKVINPNKKISWWSNFCVNNSHASIFHSSEYYAGACQQAVQAGPRLVVNGQTTPFKDDFSRKTGVGITPNNEVILVASMESMSTKSFAALFKNPESKNGLNCPNALNLDGGTSTQMYFHYQDVKAVVPGFIRVPVGLGVFSK